MQGESENALKSNVAPESKMGKPDERHWNEFWKLEELLVGLLGGTFAIVIDCPYSLP